MAISAVMSLSATTTHAATRRPAVVVAAKGGCAPQPRLRIVGNPGVLPRRTRAAPRVDPTLYMFKNLDPQWYDDEALQEATSGVSDLSSGERASQPWMARSTSPARRIVPCDVLMRDTEYVIWAELPGVGEDDVTVQIENRVLTLSAPALASTADEAAGSEESERVVMAERRREEMSRSFRVPKDVDESGIHCSMDKGVLTVVLPRFPPKSPAVRRIAVTKGSAVAPSTKPSNKTSRPSKKPDPWHDSSAPAEGDDTA